MKTKLDMIKSCVKFMSDYSKKDDAVFILNFLNKFKDTDTLDVIAKKLPSKYALFWAENIGDINLMRDQVIDHEALQWAENIGDKEIMIKKIKDPLVAVYWVKSIGDKDIMINLATSSLAALMWGRFIGDKDIMRNRLSSPIHMQIWGQYVGDRDIMKNKIINCADSFKTSKAALDWAFIIGDKEVMIHKISDRDHRARWINKWQEDKKYFIEKGWITIYEN